jgi:hypothetical protein
MQTLDNEDDIDELSTLSKKIKRSVNLVKLYDSVKPPYISDSDDSFDYQCGIGYIEDYIVKKMQERND